MTSKGESFLRGLPELFDGFPDAETPRDERLAAVLEAVPGLARPNNLALLNLAARCVAPGETYVEVGAFRGSSLIGAPRRRRPRNRPPSMKRCRATARTVLSATSLALARDARPAATATRR